VIRRDDWARGDEAELLIRELLGAGLALMDVLSSLIEELPEDAFPGEDRAEVLLEMVVGSCRPAVAAAGESDARAAISLVAAVRDSVFGDLRAAAAAARDEALAAKPASSGTGSASPQSLEFPP
jgi:hypothetical protein